MSDTMSILIIEIKSFYEIINSLKLLKINRFLMIYSYKLECFIIDK